MSNMAFGIFAKIKKINIMNISYISEQINEIVETVLPLQKSSGALQDLLFTHTHIHTKLWFYGHHTQGFNQNSFAVILASDAK